MMMRELLDECRLLAREAARKAALEALLAPADRPRSPAGVQLVRSVRRRPALAATVFNQNGKEKEKECPF